MTALHLAAHRVAKPWGRRHLWGPFADLPDEAPPLGEIWFQAPSDDGRSDLLVKYLFTSERLSVQVHPDDAQAQAVGLPRGKNECWLVVAADKDSTIALGTRSPLDRETLRHAAVDGSIEQLLDWKPVKAGDFYYVPSGTIHAIGAGITIIEIQQNCDATYRLYDYGRDRPLHLDDGLAVAAPAPFESQPAPRVIAPGRVLMVDGPSFAVERWSEGRFAIDLPPQTTGWLVPLAGRGTVDDVRFGVGECIAISGRCNIELFPLAAALFALAGPTRSAATVLRL